MIPSFLHSSNHSNDLEMKLSFCFVSYISVRFCPVDMAYWEDPIRRIGYDLASIIVEIDLTWSLGLVLVELDKLPNPLFCRTLLICLIWISKVLVDAHWVSYIDCIRSWYEGFALFLCSNHSNDLEMKLSFCFVSYISVRFCPVDMAYWEDPIRRIGYDLASIIVEIDLTWSLGLVLVELDKLPNPLFCRTLLICLIWISKVLVDAHWVSYIDCIRSWYEGFALFLW
nr:hypothetical protein [Tanacetum cinerariifolium]